MEWLERLNQAVGYIENHLEGDIEYDEAARIACCSTFHFQRMFSYIAGVPLSEYIRRRRMTCAGLALQRGEEKVIDLALRYGYDSPTAFTRAFTGVHGMPPSEARKSGIVLKAYPRISFHITIKGDTEMNYRIEHKEAFRIVGAKRHYCLDVEQSMQQVPLFWGETVSSGGFERICALPTQQPCGILGVCTCMNGKDFDYYIACATDAPVPEGMEAYTVPACTWAIFECVGPMPDAIQDLQRRVVAEWLPTSGYEYADAPDIEVYTQGDMSAADYRCEVWLPIVKKQ
jgi:AraC family transcriptional regulator